MKPQSISRERFSKIAKKALREAGNSTCYRYERDQFCLVSMDGRYTIHLGPAYLAYRKTPPADRAEVLSNFRRSWLAPLKGVPAEYEDAKPDLMPVIYNRGGFEIMRLVAQVRNLPADRHPYELIADHLGAGIVYELPEARFVLSANAFAVWKTDFTEASMVARANLLKRTDRLMESPAAGLWTSPWKDGYDATRLILTDWIRAHPVKGQHVAMVPDPDTLLVTGSEDASGLAEVANLGRQSVNVPMPISTTLLRLDGSQWVPFCPPGTGPVIQEFKTLAMVTRGRIYEDQADALSQHLQQQGQSVCVGRTQVLHGPLDQAYSLVRWVKGEKALLPRTDYLGFDASDEPWLAEDPATQLLPWDAVQQVVGARMRPMGLWPERYRVESFPTRDEFKAIAEIAVQQGKLLRP